MYTSKNGNGASTKAISVLTVNDTAISLLRVSDNAICKAKYNVMPAGFRPNVINLWLLSFNFYKSR
jgi:hypothetical protein